MQVKLMAMALASIWVKSDDLKVLWCINHIEYMPLEHIFWIKSTNSFKVVCFNHI